jgi:hypothetical protein
MTIKDRVKWYGLITGFVFLVTSIFLAINIYMEVTYLYVYKLDMILGYLKFTAGFSALTFGILFFLKPQSVKEEAKWYGVVSACLFLVVSTYMQMTTAFHDSTLPTILNYLEFISALAALIFGLLSFPKWQSLFALAVWLYSFYRFSQPAFGLN